MQAPQQAALLIVLNTGLGITCRFLLQCRNTGQRLWDWSLPYTQRQTRNRLGTSGGEYFIHGDANGEWIVIGVYFDSCLLRGSSTDLFVFRSSYGPGDPLVGRGFTLVRVMSEVPMMRPTFFGHRSFHLEWQCIQELICVH